MKAKEAAEIIKGIEEVRGSLPEDGLLVEEALNMAIKALELFGISEQLPSAQPEQHEIGYSECANAMLKMWIDNVLTDGEYNRIMDKLNTHWEKTENG